MKHCFQNFAPSPPPWEHHRVDGRQSNAMKTHEETQQAASSESGSFCFELALGQSSSSPMEGKRHPPSDISGTPAVGELMKV